MPSRTPGVVDDTEQPEAESRRLFRFDPKIDSGTILQIVVLVGGMAIGYSKIEKSLALNEQRTAQIEQRSNEQQARTEKALSELQHELKQTSLQVQDLKAKIDLLNLMVSQPRGVR
jgi:hypothetical protein